MFGCLSSTHTKPLFKLDIPSFPWPSVTFPQLKYPLSEHEAENRAEEDRCLEQVEDAIKNCKHPVAGLIVEPILAEGGDLHASPRFFQELRRITKQHGAFMIADEVQTGVAASGQFWAHEHWKLDEINERIDFVTFSKKYNHLILVDFLNFLNFLNFSINCFFRMQAAGHFFNSELLPDAPFRNFNTWVGDIPRILQAKTVISEIFEHNLLENAQITGNYLMNELEQLGNSSGKLRNVRGRGLLIAFDVDDSAQVLASLRSNGVEANVCGSNSIRLRPALTFTPKHAEIFLSCLKESL